MALATVFLTAVLALITGVYAYLTWLIAQRTDASANAARLAAEASQRAAEAAMRSALVAEATLPLSFTAKVDRHRDGKVWFTLFVKGATVMLHGAELEATVWPQLEAPSRDCDRVELRLPAVSRDRSLPVLIHRDESVSLEWPTPMLRLEDWACTGQIDLRYSLSRTGRRSGAASASNCLRIFTRT